MVKNRLVDNINPLKPSMPFHNPNIQKGKNSISIALFCPLNLKSQNSKVKEALFINNQPKAKPFFQ